MQYNNLETILVQNNVNNVYTFGNTEKGKLSSISKLLEQLNITLKIVKKRYGVVHTFFPLAIFRMKPLNKTSLL